MFFGYTQKAEDATGRPLFNRPFPIASLDEFEQLYGGEIATSICVDIEEIVKSDQKSPSFKISFCEDYQVPDFLLHSAIRHYFDNGGQSCVVTSLGNAEQQVFKRQDFIQALSVLNQEPAINLLIMPDLYSRRFEGDEFEIANLINVALDVCSKQQNCFLLCDIPAGITGANQDAISVNQFVSSIHSASDARSHGAIYYPFLETSYQPVIDWGKLTIGKHITTKIDKRGKSVSSKGKYTEVSLAELNADKSHQAVVKGVEEFVQQELSICLPASAAVAGIYCQVDTQRGVWKAAANLPVRSVSQPAVALDKVFQSQISQHSDGATNPVCFFKGRGVLVWGARTLTANDPQWQYITVRRTISWIGESVHLSLMAFVFEANTLVTWRNMESMVDDFLNTLWREGALRGEKQEQAYYVKIGLGETMTQSDIRDNKIIMRIGVALLRPAEFISFSLEIPSAH